MHIKKSNHLLLVESHTSFHSHRERMEEAYEYTHEFGKQGGKNPRKIPKFSINHEHFSCTIEIYAHTQS